MNTTFKYNTIKSSSKSYEYDLQIYYYNSLTLTVENLSRDNDITTSLVIFIYERGTEESRIGLMVKTKTKISLKKEKKRKEKKWTNTL